MATVSGLFDNYDEALAAVSRLEAFGTDRSDISIVANNADDWYGRRPADVETDSKAGEGAASGAGLGAVVGGAGGLLAGLGLLAIPGIGPVVAAGWLVATGAGAVAGAAAGGAVGGLVGSMVSEGVPEDRANVYAEGVRRGGTLVSAKVPDDRIVEAQAALDDEVSVDLVERERAYRGEGWSRFDPDAPAYTTEEVTKERARYRI
ncbi:general stress protein [Aquabacter sp. CN5-332]|uniref:general stress protein n=1 Tax=Aquabacter sp. CN5-332 TaxID=3156608 RepID=UPI0032B4816F